MLDHIPPPHRSQPVLQAGASLDQARAALLLFHGRGAGAEDILALGEFLARPGLALLAPQAAGNTWYPYSFLSPLEQNQPALDSALQAAAALVAHLEANGLSAEKIILGGFSQGACLAGEFAARHARRYGGLLLFSGGLIGPPGTSRAYPGSLDGTPVFLGCSDVDPHIPLARVQETAEALTRLGAQVSMEIYPGMDHIVVRDELERGGQIVRSVLEPRV
jgi:predicted esterase